ncbi:hypothetical protein [Chryseobacterium sp. 22458]|uniref:hypothetical protein n=1 Tax=Chryseobacterium sp. 22458 TaxID=3453921 RepID=UPI003F87F057
MFKYNINFIIISLLFIGLSSCNKNKKVLDEDLINLYPNKQIISKQYYKYSVFDPFYPNDSLYTPIAPRASDPKKAKALIKPLKFYELSYFYKYIKENIGKEYISYIYSNDIPVYRYYLKMYERGESKQFDTNKKIEEYFTKNNIDYKFVKKKPNNVSIYLLNKKNDTNSIYCTIISDSDWEKVFLTYNVKDTIKQLSYQSITPFFGSEIED